MGQTACLSSSTGREGIIFAVVNIVQGRKFEVRVKRENLTIYTAAAGYIINHT